MQSTNLPCHSSISPAPGGCWHLAGHSAAAGSLGLCNHFQRLGLRQRFAQQIWYHQTTEKPLRVLSGTLVGLEDFLSASVGAGPEAVGKLPEPLMPESRWSRSVPTLMKSCCLYTVSSCGCPLGLQHYTVECSLLIPSAPRPTRRGEQEAQSTDRKEEGVAQVRLVSLQQQVHYFSVMAIFSGGM